MHNLDTSTGRVAFAYSAEDGNTWHTLGLPIPDEIAMDPVKIAAFAGCDWNIYKAPVGYTDAAGVFHTVENRVALVRDDTHAALGVVSDSRYNPHQTREQFALIRDEFASAGLRMSAVGAIQGGRTVFGSALVPGADGTFGAKDALRRYITFACRNGDGGGSSTITDGCIRVVCQNTYQANIATATAEGGLLRIPHTSEYTASTLSRRLVALGDKWRKEDSLLVQFANRQLSQAEAALYFCTALNIRPEDVHAIRPDGKPALSTKSRNMLDALAAAYLRGPGAGLDTAAGTLWGAFNAVTYYVDHEATTRDSYGDGAGAARVASAQFGSGAAAKSRAFDLAAQLVAA